ncbi:FkbM family methyltransferase [Actinopolyspora mortivallis]|uniref:FkbM family methyltransferase n=1 Tax=Actinopolyspora mortivallis TaxID=33906 RepID=A0A2T0GYJ3_ACTMO|nr:FkbM family methyltransferase [Actinopolyspora mortivallis]
MGGASRWSVIEPEVQGLKEVVGAGDVCFDVGAAYGMYSFALARLVGSEGQVHSFEPQRKPHGILATGALLTGVGNLRISRSALGGRSGRHRITVPTRFGLPIHGHAHVSDEVSNDPPAGLFRGSRSVVTDTFSVDQIRRSRGIPRVDFMKIDVEGYEPTVLDGAEKTLEECRPVLLLEIEHRHLSRYGLEPSAFLSRLRKMGYQPHVWHSGNWIPVDGVTPRKRNYLFTASRP